MSPAKRKKEKKLKENRLLKALNCHLCFNEHDSHTGWTEKLNTTEQADVWIFNRNAT